MATLTRESYRVAGIHVFVERNERWKTIALIPDDDDIRDASILDLLRFWYSMGDWVKSYCEKRPGWKLRDDSSKI